ncbi:hypothetical protein PAPYR_13144 [Paratrimastix pyriformis]|uniref:Actin-related protein 10 n=1 Tax=Paratrimastix pyriformis TaxID=342808 RepID=A0ABQ8U0R5_9EUKA|nr:hypothetical protein PAPYR_13144 [Paratrimastix pyriformis]
MSFRAVPPNVVVLEIGSAYTKCGFAGMGAPLTIIPTSLVTPSGKKSSRNQPHREAGGRGARPPLARPFPGCPGANLADHHGGSISGVYPSPLASLYPTGLTSGLVVDCGYWDCTVTPISRLPRATPAHSIPDPRIVVLPARVDIPLGAVALHPEVASALVIATNTPEVAPTPEVPATQSFPARPPPLRTLPAPITIQFPGPEDEPAVQGPAPGAETKEEEPSVLSPGFSLRARSLCAACTKRLFVHGDPMAERTLVDALMECLNKCTADQRPLVVQNIVLVGGLATLPGFRKRFCQELRRALEASPYPALLPRCALYPLSTLHQAPRFDLAPATRVPAAPGPTMASPAAAASSFTPMMRPVASPPEAPFHFPPSIMTWVGASIIGALKPLISCPAVRLTAAAIAADPSLLLATRFDPLAPARIAPPVQPPQPPAAPMRPGHIEQLSSGHLERRQPQNAVSSLNINDPKMRRSNKDPERSLQPPNVLLPNHKTNKNQLALPRANSQPKKDEAMEIEFGVKSQQASPMMQIEVATVPPSAGPMDAQVKTPPSSPVPVFTDILNRWVNWMQSFFPSLANSRRLKAQLEEIANISRADDVTLMLGLSLLLRYLNAAGPELVREHGRESEIFYIVLLSLHLAQKVTKDKPIFNGSLCKALHLRPERLLFNELQILQTLGWSCNLSMHDLNQLALALALPRDSLEIWVCLVVIFELNRLNWMCALFFANCSFLFSSLLRNEFGWFLTHDTFTFSPTIGWMLIVVFRTFVTCGWTAIC